MRAYVIALLLLLSSGPVPGQPTPSWTYLVDLPSNLDHWTSIVSTTDGGFLLGGYSWTNDLVYRDHIWKLDADFQPQWQRQQLSTACKLNTLSTDGAAVWSCSDGDSLRLVRRDRYGNPLWQQIRSSSSGDGDHADLTHVFVREDGVCIAPYVYRSFFSGQNWIELTRFDADGTLAWVLRLDGPDGIVRMDIPAVRFLPEDQIELLFRSGSQLYLTTIDAASGEVLSSLLSDHPMNSLEVYAAARPAGGYVLAEAGNDPTRMTQIDVQGVEIWSHMVGEGGNWFRGVIATADGGALATGSEEHFKPWAVKLAADGAVEWTFTRDGSFIELYESIETSPGHYVLAGTLIDQWDIADYRGYIVVLGEEQPGPNLTLNVTAVSEYTLPPSGGPVTVRVSGGNPFDTPQTVQAALRAYLPNGSHVPLVNRALTLQPGAFSRLLTVPVPMAAPPGPFSIVGSFGPNPDDPEQLGAAIFWKLEP
ncbi:hypothetical protein KQI52_10830 [bacterium]|nr:hypothetical protein [bacterium]